MVILDTCKYMNWDYITYMNQPNWMIDLIEARISGEEKAKKYIKLKRK